MSDPLTLRAALSDLNARLAALGDELDAAAIAHGRAPTPESRAAVDALAERYRALGIEQGAALDAHLAAQREEIAGLAAQARRIRSHLDGTAASEQDQTARRAALQAAFDESEAQAIRQHLDGTEPDVIIGAAGPEQAERLARISQLTTDRGWHVWPALQPEVVTICIDDRPDWSGDDAEWRGFIGCDVDLRTGAVTPQIEACGTEAVADAAEIMCDLGTMAAALQACSTTSEARP